MTTTITIKDYNDAVTLLNAFYGEDGWLICNYLEDPVLQVRTLWDSDNCKSKAIKIALAVILSTACVEDEEILNDWDEWTMAEYLHIDYCLDNPEDYEKLLKKAEDIESQLDDWDWNIIEFLNNQKECRVFDTTCWIR